MYVSIAERYISYIVRFSSAFIKTQDAAYYIENDGITAPDGASSKFG